MHVSPSGFRPPAIQTSAGCLQAPSEGQGGESAFQVSVLLPLSQESNLNRPQRVAGCGLLPFLKSGHCAVQQFALRVFGGRQVLRAPLVSRLHVLVAHAVQWSHGFGRCASAFVRHDLLSLPALAGVGVESLAWGRVDLLGAQARCVGVDRFPVLVASIDLGACTGAGKGDQGGCESSLHVSSPSNVGAWLSIADFLARQNLRAVLAERAARSAASGKRSAAAAQGAALNSTLPHGNHGENNQ